MELTRLIDDLQQALAGHDVARGAKVSMVISSASDSQPDMSISFRVPRTRQEAEKEAPDCTEITMQGMIREAAELLLGQMDMTQERMAVDQPDEKNIAALNVSMTGMAHALTGLSNEARCWEHTTADKLRMMRDIEAHNDENIRKWVDGPCAK